MAKSAQVRPGIDPPSRICSVVAASPGIVISLTSSRRPGDGQVQYLAGSSNDTCVLSAQTPGAYRSQAGSATPFTALGHRPRGNRGVRVGPLPGAVPVSSLKLEK